MLVTLYVCVVFILFEYVYRTKHEVRSEELAVISSYIILIRSIDTYIETKHDESSNIAHSTYTELQPTHSSHKTLHQSKLLNR